MAFDFLSFIVVVHIALLFELRFLSLFSLLCVFFFLSLDNLVRLLLPVCVFQVWIFVNLLSLFTVFGVLLSGSLNKIK